MAGALDTVFKNVAKSVVADLGKALDHAIIYTRKTSPSYNVATGALTTTDTTYSFNAPLEFIESTEKDLGQEQRRAKLYVTPDLIGDNQPNFGDTVTLTYAGSSRVSQIMNIRTYKGGQEYLYIIEVMF